MTNEQRAIRPFFIGCDLDELMQGADEIRKAYRGERVDLCTIINGKSGRCRRWDLQFNPFDSGVYFIAVIE